MRRLAERLERAGYRVSLCPPLRDTWGKDWNERWQRIGSQSAWSLYEAFAAVVPDPAIDWHGPGHLGRRQENYKQFHATLPGTKEVHVLALPVSAHIAEGMLHPSAIPKPKEEQGSSSPPIQPAQVDRSRSS